LPAAATQNSTPVTVLPIGLGSRPTGRIFTTIAPPAAVGAAELTGQAESARAAHRARGRALPSTVRNPAAIAAARPRRPAGPALAMHGDREASEAEQGNTRKSSGEERVMMFAFVLALIGIIVLETLEHVAAHA